MSPTRRPQSRHSGGLGGTPDAGDRGLHQVARGGTLNVVGAVVSAAAGFGIVLVVARLSTSTAAAGAFFVVLALSKVAIEVGQLGAGIGLVRTVSRAIGMRQTRALDLALGSAFGPVFVVSTTAGLIFIVFAGPLAALLVGPAQREAMHVYLTVFGTFLPAAVGLNLVLNATRGFGTMKPGVLLNYLLRAGLQVCAVATVLLLSGGPLAVSVAYNLPFVVSFVGAILWLRRLRARHLITGINDRVVSRRSIFVSFWRFSLPRAAAGAFSVSIQWVDTLLISVLASTADAGIYAAGVRFVVLATFIHSALVQAIQPILSSLIVAGDRDATNKLFKAATAWEVLLLWPMQILVALFASVFLSFLGPDYAAARPTLWILASAWMVATSVGPVDALLLMGGKSVWSMGNLGIALVVNILGNFVLIPRIGITGAALAWMASVLLHNLLPLYQVRRFLRVSPFGLTLAQAIGVSTVCFGAVGVVARLAVGETMVGLIVTVLVGGAFYVFALRHLWEQLNLDDLVSAIRRPKQTRGRPSVAHS